MAVIMCVLGRGFVGVHSQVNILEISCVFYETIKKAKADIVLISKVTTYKVLN